MSNTAGNTFGRMAIAAIGITIGTSLQVQAQDPAPTKSSWEVRVTGGALVPTGAQRNVLDDAKLTAAQVAWLIRPTLAITGTFGWARSRDIATPANPKLDVFTTDVGVEFRPRRWFANQAVNFDALAGVGAGARSYNYRKLDVAATHNVAGYAAVGGELGVGRVGVRLEVRDYVSAFKPLNGSGESQARNDIIWTAAVRINRPR